MLNLTVLKSRLLYFIVSMVFVLSVTIPFLNADPDNTIKGVRDANTDEGLNTCQIRNYVNSGDLTLYKSDNLIKTPGFASLLYLPFDIFGTSRFVARFTTFAITSVIFLLVFSSSKFLHLSGLIFIATTFLQSLIFHYFHYSMAEVISGSFIFLGIYYFSIKINNLKNRDLMVSTFFIAFSYFTKLQYIYAMAIIPISVLFLVFFSKSQKFKITWLHFTSSMIFSIIWLSIYYGFWYLPNKTFMEYVMNNQIAGRFMPISDMWLYLKYLIVSYFAQPQFVSQTIIAIIAFFIGVSRLLKSKNMEFVGLFVPISIWLLLEMHKLTMTYLPPRYLVTMFIAAGLLTSVVIASIIMSNSTTNYNKYLKFSMVGLVVLVLGFNLVSYKDSYKNRTYEIKKADDYLASKGLENKHIVGAWATSIAWKSKAITYPVWRGYFNHNELFVNRIPNVVVSEFDEEDSNQEYLSRGIELKNLSDSVKTLSVNGFDLNIFWIKK